MARISEKMKNEIHHLYGQYNKRQLATMFNVNIKTVRRLLSGKPEPPKKEQDHYEGVPDITNWTGIIGKCQECGRLVKLPCLACRIEAFKNKTRKVK